MDFKNGYIIKSYRNKAGGVVGAVLMKVHMGCCIL